MDIIHSFLDFFAEQIARDLIIQFVLFWIVTCLFLRKIIIKNPKRIFTKNVINDLSYLITNKVIFAPMWLVIVIAIIDTSPLTAVSESSFASFINNMPFWQQLIIGMLVYDLFAYWRHRLLHSDALWPIHAIHHSSKELTWISGIRNHPLNTLFIAIFGVMILFVLGFSSEAIFWIGMVRLYWVNFVHMNFNFSLGPLDYVIVTPRFHRWHHVPLRQGGQNYAGFFSFYDYMFGTFYLPDDKVAEKFGNGHKDYPQDFTEQLAWPIKVYVMRVVKRFKKADQTSD